MGNSLNPISRITIQGMLQQQENRKLITVNCCSNSNIDWQIDLSPFKLGPCGLYIRDRKMLVSQNMENAWQFAKVYREHATKTGKATFKYWEWAYGGWNDTKAHRYPMGKGAIPLHSLWKGERLGYIDARKMIYAPLYRDLVTQTQGYKELKKLVDNEQPIVLRDFDGYDHDKLGMSLTDVLNDPKRKMGHAFVLKMLLTNDTALKDLYA